MSVNNPYSEMVAIMQRQGRKYNPPSILVGSVISPSPNLVIKLNDLQLDRDNILISDFLLPNGLKSGDNIAVLPMEDRQRFIILCKVVDLGG